MRKSPLLVLVIGLILGGAIPRIALCQSEAVNIEDLTRQADVIVVGEVTNVRSEWNSDKTRIYSRVTVLVSEHIKGDRPENSLTISTPGGEVDGIGEVYSHMARFKEDEQVIVFAAQDRQGRLHVIDGDKGKIMVRTNAETGQHLVSESEPLEVFTAKLKGVVRAQDQK